MPLFYLLLFKLLQFERHFPSFGKAIENAVMDEENNGLFLLFLYKLLLHLSGNKKIVLMPAQSQDLPNNCTYNANVTLRF